jgi:hypothetical protein
VAMSILSVLGPKVHASSHDLLSFCTRRMSANG